MLTLWRGLGKPDLEEFQRQVCLVAEWAQQAPDEEAAREIRAEGWADGTDRSRKVGNICRQRPPGQSGGATWDDRLLLAEVWEAAGRPLVKGVEGAKSTGGESWPWEDWMPVALQPKGFDSQRGAGLKTEERRKLHQQRLGLRVIGGAL